MNLTPDPDVESERLTRIEDMLESIIDHFNIKPSRAAIVKDYYGAAAEQEALLIEKGMSPKDAAARARVITDYLLRAGGKVNPDSMANYLAGLATPAQRNIALKALRPWARDSLELGAWPDKFKFASVQAQPKTQSISKQEIQDVSVWLGEHQQEYAQAAWLALYWSGLRPAEVLGLSLDEIDVAFGRLDATRLHAGKNKHAGVSFVPRAVAESLAEARVVNKGPLGYKEFYDAVERAKKDAYVSGLTAKDLRRHFADVARSVGVPNDIIDALQGRAPKSILAKHYTSTGQQTLKEYWERIANGLKFNEPQV